LLVRRSRLQATDPGKPKRLESHERRMSKDHYPAHGGLAVSAAGGRWGGFPTAVSASITETLTAAVSRTARHSSPIRSPQGVRLPPQHILGSSSGHTGVARADTGAPSGPVAEVAPEALTLTLQGSENTRHSATTSAGATRTPPDAPAFPAVPPYHAHGMSTAAAATHGVTRWSGARGAVRGDLEPRGAQGVGTAPGAAAAQVADARMCTRLASKSSGSSGGATATAGAGSGGEGGGLVLARSTCSGGTAAHRKVGPVGGRSLPVSGSHQVCAW
jgi:hypothetical protein